MPSFKEAFAAARKAKGAGKTFTWNGKLYTTNYKEEAPKATSPRPKAKPVTVKTPAKPLAHPVSKPPVKPLAHPVSKTPAPKAAPKAATKTGYTQVPAPKASTRAKPSKPAVKVNPGSPGVGVFKAAAAFIRGGGLSGRDARRRTTK